MPTPTNPRPSSLQSSVRPPLQASDADSNGGIGVALGPRRPRAREVASRYMSSLSASSSSSSSSSANSSASRRTASPLAYRTPPDATPSPSLKRSQSAERRRPATAVPWASAVDSKVGGGGQAPVTAASKVLFTATRSLSVSFQGESFSLQISKSKPSPIARKGTPERRKQTPARGGRADQVENSKPVDQQRWPARSREAKLMNRSVDLTDERKRLGGSANVVAHKPLQPTMGNETPKALLRQSLMNESPRALLRQSLMGEISKSPAVDRPLESNLGNGKLEKAVQPAVALESSETSDLMASDTRGASSANFSAARECDGVAQGRREPSGVMLSARPWHDIKRSPDSGSPNSKGNGLKTVAPTKLILPKKLANDSPTSSPRTRGLSSPLRVPARPASPSKLGTSSPGSTLRQMASPSRVRTSAVSTFNNTVNAKPSILNFTADARRGKIGENWIVDAHLLRILHNREMQWRFVNARANAAMLKQGLTEEKCLYDAWITTSKLRDSVKDKRKELHLLRQTLKLTSILKRQMLYLRDWALLERDHSNSLSGATEALAASTLRLPVIGGTRANIQDMKDAICSAVDVMQAMASSIRSLLSKVEEINYMVGELANITTMEKMLLSQCKDLLSVVATNQVVDCSLRTHVLQLNRLPSGSTTIV